MFRSYGKYGGFGDPLSVRRTLDRRNAVDFYKRVLQVRVRSNAESIYTTTGLTTKKVAELQRGGDGFSLYVNGKYKGFSSDLGHMKQAADKS